MKQNTRNTGPRSSRTKAASAAAGPVKAEPAKMGARARPAPAAKPKKAAKPNTAAAPQPVPAPEGAPPAFLYDLGPMLMTPGNREAIETLSANLARAALTAQGAMAEAVIRRADQAPSMSADPFNIAPAMGEVMSQLARQPERLMRAQADLFTRHLDLWQSTARRMADGQPVEPVVKPGAGDRRFADQEWQSNPVFDVIKQSYLLQSNWLNDLVSGVEDIDPQTKRRAEFFMKMLTDAFSPSNFLISNPAALREAIETRGESLVRGMRNFAADLERGGGSLQITQTDATKFQVGVNVATAPGKVVFQNQLLQLLQFEPTTEAVFDIPLLIFPPWINKYYILDLRPENSMIRWLTSQGFTVFVVSWVNPDGSLAKKTFEDYMIDGIQAAVGAVLKQTGARKVNAVGYCIAGTLLSCTLAYMAAKKDDRIASATFFAAQQDFSESGDLRLFTEEDWLRSIEISMDDAGGFLPGAGDVRHLQRPARQRPGVVVLHQQLPDGQGAQVVRPAVLELGPDAHAQDPAHGVPAPVLSRQRLEPGRAGAGRGEAGPEGDQDAGLRHGVARGPHLPLPLGLSGDAAVRRPGDLHPIGIGPYRRRDQRAGRGQIPDLDQ